MDDLRTIDNKHHGIKLCISAVLIIYVLYGLAIYWYRGTFVFSNPLASWTVSEWLINFEGGFVRRGLLGEGIYLLCVKLNITPLYIISFLCLGIYFFLFIFYLRKFRERGLSWWFLCGPMMFGFVTSFLRKDFLLISLVILIVTLLKKRGTPIYLQLIAGLITIFGLLVHEAFFFFGAPIAILLLRGNGSKVIAMIVAILVIVEFGSLCYFKGSLEVGEGIVSSWNTLLDKQLLYAKDINSIGALGWDTLQTFKTHFEMNVGAEYHACGVIVQIVILFGVYYLLINFMQVFQSPSEGFTRVDQTNVGALFMLLAVTMLPMFTVLSCDYARLYQYEVMSIVGVYLLVDREVLRHVIPANMIKLSTKVNSSINRTLVPERAWILALFMILGISGVDFSIENAFAESILGKISVLFGSLMQGIHEFIFN